MTAPTRPLVRYHGGKWRLAPWIISHFPAHKVYVEPFGGGASVLLQKAPVVTEIYNDLDGEVFNLFRVVREAGDALARSLELTPFSRQEYELAYAPSDDRVEQARRTVVKSFMGMGSKGIWIRSGFDARINPDGFVGRLNSFAAVARELPKMTERLRRVLLENVNAIDLIRRYKDREDALFYIDPPYVQSSYSGGNVYSCRYSDDDHRALQSVLNECRGAVILSGYPSNLYDELYRDWTKVETGARADAGARRVEVLWLKGCRHPQGVLL